MTTKYAGAAIFAALLGMNAHAQSTSTAPIADDEGPKATVRAVAPLGMAYPVGYFEGYVNWGGLSWWCDDIQRTYVAYGDESGVTDIEFAGYGSMSCYHEWFGWQLYPADFYYSGPWQDCLSEFGSDCPLYCNWFNYPTISGCQGSFQVSLNKLLSKDRRFRLQSFGGTRSGQSPANDGGQPAGTSASTRGRMQ